LKLLTQSVGSRTKRISVLGTATRIVDSEHPSG
jgi:hypothetical protein